MAGTTSGTPRVRALGDALREAREAVGLGVRELGRRIGMPHSTLSRYELGQRSPSPEDVATILAAVGIDDRRREELLALAREPEKTQWLSVGMTEQQRQLAALLNFERSAKRIVDVAPLLVPGLLQTADYARAIMSEGGVSEEEIDTRVAVRLGRRDALERKEPVSMVALIGMSVLQQDIGGPAVMLDQLRHLLRMAVLPNVEIRIIPTHSRWNPSLEGPFLLVEPMDDETSAVVHLENRRSALLMHEEVDVNAYREGVEKVLRVALTSEESLTVIKREAENQERAIE
ncbi:MAG: helix-turn-helix domain-containing protein [Actinomycetota bacterium]|nr:helix-turn-helix domain-containing protein [Actinomycetota bacterium]